MPEVGEEIVGAYLKECLRCDFVEYNYDLGVGQAECDVVAINVHTSSVYFCEVATHTGGLLYVHPKTKKPDNIARLTRKFSQNVEFARRNFPAYEQHFMFWSPVVRKAGPRAKHDPVSDVQQVREYCARNLEINLELVINEEYWKKLQELRAIARAKGPDSSFSIVRFLQIEEKLKKHLYTTGRRLRSKG